MGNNEFGVLYIVLGDNHYYKRAKLSIKSLLETNKGINVTVITDKDRKFSNQVNVNKVNIKNKNLLKERIRLLRFLPYKKTLMIDVDTRIHGDLSEISRYLDKYDLCVAEQGDVNRSKKRWSNDFFNGYKIKNIFNCGVVGFKRNDNVLSYIKDWYNIFKTYDNSKVSTSSGYNDQSIFNYVHKPQDYLNVKIMDNIKYNARGTIIPFLKKENKLNEIIISHSNKRWEFFINNNFNI